MKLNTKRTLFVGLAFMIICMFWGVYDVVVPKMLVNTFGLGHTASGVVMALDNVLALFLLPFFGSLSDKCTSKYGKRTPFIVVGTILAACLVTGVAIFDGIQLNMLTANNIPVVVRDNFATQELYDIAWAARQAQVWELTKSNIFYLIALVGMLLLVLVSMATFRSPAVALMPDVTPKPLRSKANAIINLMGTFGGIISLGLLAVLAKDFHSYVLVFAVIAVLMIGGLIFFLFKVNEPKLVEIMHEESKVFEIEEEVEESNSNEGVSMSKEVKKSFYLILASIFLWFMAYNAATTKFSLYAQSVLAMDASLPLLVAQAAAVVSYIPIGIIASKFGRRRTILAGIILLATAFGFAFFIGPNTNYLAFVALAIAGIGWATINVNSYPMVVEMAKGSDVGKYTGYYYAASMSAQVITPIASGFLMDKLGTMKVLFPYSLLFAIIAFTTMFFVRHGDSKPLQKKSAIESFDVED